MMAITIYPSTGGDNVGFIDDQGRRYLIDRNRNPGVEALIAGESPDYSIVSRAPFAQDKQIQWVDYFEDDNGCYEPILVFMGTTDLRVTRTELATIHVYMVPAN